MSHVHCITHIINLVEQIVYFVFGCAYMICLTSSKAFLAPFKAPKHWKCNTNHACVADDEVSQYAYETGDADIANKVNASLEDLHVDDNDNDEMAQEDTDLEVVEEEAAKVVEMESQTALELGGITNRECEAGMSMLSKVSLASAWHE